MKIQELLRWVDRDQRLLEIDLLQQLRYGGDFVRFRLGRNLAQGDSFLAGPGTDNVQRTQTLRRVVRASAGLPTMAINRASRCRRFGSLPQSVKYASAHDPRRAFGARWATKAMPIVLQQLLRHESIETTLKYYVGQNAEAMADAVWATVERVGIWLALLIVALVRQKRKK